MDDKVLRQGKLKNWRRAFILQSNKYLPVIFIFHYVILSCFIHLLLFFQTDIQRIMTNIINSAIAFLIIILCLFVMHRKFEIYVISLDKKFRENQYGFHVFISY